MADIRTLKPAEGLIVRDPVTLLPLPPEGAEVEMNSYWHRRLLAEEVSVKLPGKKNTKGGDSVETVGKE